MHSIIHKETRFVSCQALSSKAWTLLFVVVIVVVVVVVVVVDVDIFEGILNTPFFKTYWPLLVNNNALPLLIRLPMTT